MERGLAVTFGGLNRAGLSVRKPAISGDMPRFPFTSSESVFRVTPSASAACVMVNSKGSMHSCSTTVPGWGGFFIAIVMSR